MACSGCGTILGGVIGLAKASMIAAGSSVDAAPADVVAARRNLCRGCEYNSTGELVKIRIQSQCSRCGCFIVAKTMLASEACPLGEWATSRQQK